METRRPRRGWPPRRCPGRGCRPRRRPGGAAWAARGRGWPDFPSRNCRGRAPDGHRRGGVRDVGADEPGAAGDQKQRDREIVTDRLRKLFQAGRFLLPYPVDVACCRTRLGPDARLPSLWQGWTVGRKIGDFQRGPAHGLLLRHRGAFALRHPVSSPIPWASAKTSKGWRPRTAGTPAPEQARRQF